MSNLNVEITWDESGYEKENEVELVVVCEDLKNKLSNYFVFGGNVILQDLYRNQELVKIINDLIKSMNNLRFRFGCKTRHEVGINSTFDYKFYNLETVNTEHIRFFFFLNLKNDLKFYNLEHLSLKINDKGKLITYEKKLSEIQDGSIFHIGDLSADGFETKFNYIKSKQSIEKQFKIKIRE